MPYRSLKSLTSITFTCALQAELGLLDAAELHLSCTLQTESGLLDDAEAGHLSWLRYEDSIEQTEEEQTSPVLVNPAVFLAADASASASYDTGGGPAVCLLNGSCPQDEDPDKGGSRPLADAGLKGARGEEVLGCVW